MKTTFAELLDKYQVEIPIIQRDYAQGRKSKEALRESFIESMLTAAQNGDSLELDFIYGPVENDIFSPLDGQQRLTTLYLLHWYMQARGELENARYLSRFSYQVRITTQEFCTALLDEKKGGTLFKELNASTPKEEILDASWYYSIWDYDPSIQGMLNTLDTIHEQYENMKPKNLSLENILFNLLVTNDIGLGDEIYMRMNARGIPLTDFENFKAWLQGYVSSKSYFTTGDYAKWTKIEEKETSAKWLSLLDKEWTDLIWRYAGKGAEVKKGSDYKGKSKLQESLFDTYFLRLFKGFAQFGIAESVPPKSETSTLEIKNKWVKDLSVEKNKDNSVISLAHYKKMECFREGILSDIFKLLDFFSGDEAEDRSVVSGFYFKEDEDAFYRFLEHQDYKDKAIIYALVQYLKNNGWLIADGFHQYQRVLRNLIENTVISNVNFINILESIKQMAKTSSDAYAYIIKDQAKGKDSDLKYFDEYQRNEEALKATLLTSTEGALWKDKIEKAEKHPLFLGQIGFLLKKENKKLELSDMDESDLELFAKYSQLSEVIWCKDGASDFNKDRQLVMKSMIAVGMSLRYNMDLSNNITSWKKNFHDCNHSVIKILNKILSSQNSTPPLSETLISELLTGLVQSASTDLPKNCRSILLQDKSPFSSHDYLKNWLDGDAEIGRMQLWKHGTARGDNRLFISPIRDLLIHELLNQEWGDEIDPVLLNVHGIPIHSPYPDVFLEEWCTVGLKIQENVYACLTTNGDRIHVGIRRHGDMNITLDTPEQVKKIMEPTGIYTYHNNYWWFFLNSTNYSERKNAVWYVSEIISLYKLVAPHIKKI